LRLLLLDALVASTLTQSSADLALLAVTTTDAALAREANVCLRLVERLAEWAAD